MLSEQILKIFLFFSIGFSIPSLSRFLMKFYPCSLHSYLGDLLKYNFKKKSNKKQNKTSLYHNKINTLKKQYFFNRILWGILYTIICITLTYLIENYIDKDYPLILLYIILFLLGFSANIDNRCRLIPDIITLPLLLIGFLIAVLSANSNSYSALTISPLDSIFSSLGAYILCSSLALLFYFKIPYAFGGGDVKLLTSLAAFTGFENLGKILIISFIIMVGYCGVKKERFAPLAPFVFSAFIIWIFAEIIFEILH